MTDPERLGEGTDAQHGQDDTREYAHRAAAAGAAVHGRGAQPWLLEGLKAREAFLKSTVERLHDDQGEQALTHEALSHAAEWILDNFYLAQQSLRQVREDMPRSFYQQLPKLVAGPLQGYPRIYDVALRLVADSDACLEMEFVRRFVVLYQEVQPLTIGEIWALPVIYAAGGASALWL